jgi:hypothetical protein
MKINIDGIMVFVEDSDHYLQIDDICDADFKRIWQHLKNDYVNYDKWFCYHNMECPSEILTGELGAVLEDDNIETRLTSLDFNKYDDYGIMRVTDENFAEFAVYHDELHPEMYWTSERLKRDLSRWGIFILQVDNKIAGYIILSIRDALAEIFCAETSNSIQRETLIAYASKFAFDNGKDEVLFMVDKNSIDYKAALSVGFNVTGFYKGYKISRIL